MVGTEHHDWPNKPITVEFYGGPRDGNTVTWKPGDPHWVKIKAKQFTHLYLLTGNLDDGFKFVHEGVQNAE